jgi:hypothetical protein
VALAGAEGPIGPQIKSKPFWASLHQELQRGTVYDVEAYAPPAKTDAPRC